MVAKKSLVAFLLLGALMLASALALGAPAIVSAQGLAQGPQQTPPGQVDTATPTPQDYVILITPTPSDIEPIYNIGQLNRRNEKSGNGNQYGLDAVNQLITDVLPRLIASQDSNNRRQYLSTHSIPPKPDHPQYPDRWFDATTDTQAKWDTVIDYAEMSYAMEVTTYDGLNGSGWFVCFRVSEVDGIYERCESYGPVDHGHDWMILQQP